MHNHNPLPATKKRQLLHVGMLITRPQLMHDTVRTRPSLLWYMFTIVCTYLVSKILIYDYGRY